MKSAALSLAALALSIAPAAAQVNCQLGAGFGYTLATTEISVGVASIDGVSSHSTKPDASVRGECGYKFASQVYLGAFGEYEWRDVAFAVNPGGFSASLGDAYSVGGRVGYVLNSTAMPYVGVAYKHTDINWSVVNPMLPSSTQGVSYIGGVEFSPFPQNSVLHLVTISPEVRYTDYDAVSIGTGDRATKLQTNELAAMLRVNVNFYSSPAPAYQSLK